MTVFHVNCGYLKNSRFSISTVNCTMRLLQEYFNSKHCIRAAISVKCIVIQFQGISCYRNKLLVNG